MLNILFLNYVSYLCPNVWWKKLWNPVAGTSPDILQTKIFMYSNFIR